MRSERCPATRRFPLAPGLILFCILHSAFCISFGATPDSTTAPEPAPFLRFRDTALGYHGPSVDFTNLTEIRIGWFGPTNLADPLSGDLWHAANLAFREANEASAATEPVPGIPDPGLPISSSPLPAPRSLTRAPSSELRAPLPFRLVPRWSVNPWGTGVSQLTRMVYDEQPLALIGSVDSASTHLAEQITAKANLPLVSPVATDPSVTLAGVSWMFACAPSDAAIARVVVADVLAALPTDRSQKSEVRSQRAEGRGQRTEGGGRRAEDGGRRTEDGNPKSRTTCVLLTCTDHESRMLTREVLREFSQRGRLPDYRFDVPPGSADFDQQMKALAEIQPAAVLILAGVEDSARLVRAVRRSSELEARSSERVIFGTQSMGRSRFRELAGPAAEGVRFPLLCAMDPADPRAARFAALFQAERNRAPDYAAVLTYDATTLLVEAIRRAGPNRARIREALIALSPWPGLAGVIHFDGTGQNTRTNIGMATIQNGDVVVPPPDSSRIRMTADRTVKP